MLARHRTMRLNSTASKELHKELTAGNRIAAHKLHFRLDRHNSDLRHLTWPCSYRASQLAAPLTTLPPEEDRWQRATATLLVDIQSVPALTAEE